MWHVCKDRNPQRKDSSLITGVVKEGLWKGITQGTRRGPCRACWWHCRKRRHNIPQRFPPHQGMKRFSVGSEQSCVGSASRTDAQISITLLVVLFILLLVLRKYIWAGLGFKKRSLIVSNSLICLENYTIWGLKSLKSLKWDVSNSILRARKIKSKDRVRARINVG